MVQAHQRVGWPALRVAVSDAGSASRSFLRAAAAAVASAGSSVARTTGCDAYSAIMPTKCQGSFWANWPRTLTEPAFETAHQPAAGLMAFIGRPSPVFIEIAQKIAVWTGTVSSSLDSFTRFDEAAVGLTDFTGVVGDAQVRSKAWGPRQIFHATFLSPDAHPWKAGGREWVDRNVR